MKMQRCMQHSRRFKPIKETISGLFTYNTFCVLSDGADAKDECAFYNAVAQNESVRDMLGNEVLL